MKNELFGEMCAIPQSTALFTSISGLSPTARDALGNPVPVSLLDGTPRLRAGNNIVYWQAIDPTTQSVQTVGQLYRVFPQVNFEQRKEIYEGGDAKITVHLNGVSPIYPVTIPVRIESNQSSSDLSDHTLDTTIYIIIDSGLSGEARFSVVDDNLDEGIENLMLTFGEGVNSGPFDHLELNLLETDPIPYIKANIVDSQGNIRSLVYPELTDQLELQADIFKPNDDMQVVIKWYLVRDGERALLGETLDESKLAIEKSLSVGRHHFDYEAHLVNSEADLIKGRVTLSVIKTGELSIAQDSDNDGVPDKVEGFSDKDRDLIPDYLDAVQACELQVIDNDQALSGGFVLQSTPGSCIQLGELSEKVGTYSPYVSNEQRGTSNRLLPPDTANIDRYSESEVVNFTITEVIGDNVTIVLPLMKPYTEGSEYRKFTEREGWFTFDEGNVSDNLRYAQGELGFCPPPGSNDYSESPLVGAYCLEVTIQDGGRHDNDGVINGIIGDPGYMAYSRNTLTLSGFTVEADREPVGDNKTVTSTFNLCDYLLVDCSELVIVSGNIEYGGHVQVDGHQVTVTFPIWAGDVSLNLTISDGLDAVNVPVILAQPIVEKETTNRVQGGTMGWYALWLLFLSALSRGLSIKFYPKSDYAIH